MDCAHQVQNKVKEPRMDSAHHKAQNVVGQNTVHLAEVGLAGQFCLPVVVVHL